MNLVVKSCRHKWAYREGEAKRLARLWPPLRDARRLQAAKCRACGRWHLRPQGRHSRRT
jgi:hypothetical protein